LQPKKNNGQAWLRIAAILVLVIAGFVVYLLSPVRSVKQIPVAVADDPQQNKATITPGNNDRETTVMTTSSKTIKTKQKTFEKEAGSTLNEEQATPIEMPANISATIETIPAATLNDRLAEIDPAPVVTNNTIAKKPRLRIVHLNELYKPNPSEIAQAETKKQQAAEDVQETEPVNVPPPRPFWRSKAPARTAISLTDNQ
jgi:hypothetical protein